MEQRTEAGPSTLDAFAAYSDAVKAVAREAQGIALRRVAPYLVEHYGTAVAWADVVERPEAYMDTAQFVSPRDGAQAEAQYQRDLDQLTGTLTAHDELLGRLARAAVGAGWALMHFPYEPRERRVKIDYEAQAKEWVEGGSADFEPALGWLAGQSEYSAGWAWDKVQHGWSGIHPATVARAPEQPALPPLTHRDCLPLVERIVTARAVRRDAFDAGRSRLVGHAADRVAASPALGR